MSADTPEPDRPDEPGAPAAWAEPDPPHRVGPADPYAAREPAPPYDATTGGPPYAPTGVPPYGGPLEYVPGGTGLEYAAGYPLAPPAEPDLPRGRAVRLALLAVLASSVLGVPLGLLWAALAPDTPVLKVAEGAVYAEPQPEQPIAADGWFSLLGLGFGVLAALALWFLLRRVRGPVGLFAAVLGAFGAALVAWQVGRRTGLAGYERLLENAPVRAGLREAGRPAGRRDRVGVRRAAGAARQPAAARVRRGRDVHPAGRLVPLAVAAPGARAGAPGLSWGSAGRQLRQRHRNRPDLAQQRRLAVEQAQLGAQPGGGVVDGQQPLPVGHGQRGGRGDQVGQHRRVLRQLLGQLLAGRRGSGPGTAGRPQITRAASGRRPRRARPARAATPLGGQVRARCPVDVGERGTCACPP